MLLEPQVPVSLFIADCLPSARLGTHGTLYDQRYTEFAIHEWLCGLSVPYIVTCNKVAPCFNGLERSVGRPLIKIIKNKF